jgi:hypothetical protein
MSEVVLNLVKSENGYNWFIRGQRFTLSSLYDYAYKTKHAAKRAALKAAQARDIIITETKEI